ncbi:MAG: lipopolysaccharide core heptose(I) kinase RfaP [Deltaproteobacteria bacterium]|nr:lipopolysaccharide core heptose(I) kinase RfaP [Deltaproteobacteria bacterium]
MIVLSKYFQQRWKDIDIFETLLTLKGKVYREKDGRKTFQTTIDGKNYFIKLYLGIGWKELIKSIVRFRLPVLSAQNEWKAIQQLEALKIETMQLAGYGKQGWSPAHRQSFIITDELSYTQSLENFCRNWASTPPDNALKRALIRDFYICHFLFDISVKRKKVHHHDQHLYLIDLHRMRKQYGFQRRGKIKDIAALYFSSMDIGLTQRDLLRFIRIYQNKPLKSALLNKSFWRRVNRRAISLYCKANARKPSSVF